MNAPRRSARPPRPPAAGIPPGRVVGRSRRRPPEGAGRLRPRAAAGDGPDRLPREPQRRGGHERGAPGRRLGDALRRRIGAQQRHSRGAARARRRSRHSEVPRDDPEARLPASPRAGPGRIAAPAGAPARSAPDDALARRRERGLRRPGTGARSAGGGAPGCPVRARGRGLRHGRGGRGQDRARRRLRREGPCGLSRGGRLRRALPAPRDPAGALPPVPRGARRPFGQAPSRVAAGQPGRGVGPRGRRVGARPLGRPRGGGPVARRRDLLAGRRGSGPPQSGDPRRAARVDPPRLLRPTAAPPPPRRPAPGGSRLARAPRSSRALAPAEPAPRPRRLPPGGGPRGPGAGPGGAVGRGGRPDRAGRGVCPPRRGPGPRLRRRARGRRPERPRGGVPERALRALRGAAALRRRDPPRPQLQGRPRSRSGRTLGRLWAASLGGDPGEGRVAVARGGRRARLLRAARPHGRGARRGGVLPREAGGRSRGAVRAGPRGRLDRARSAALPRRPLALARVREASRRPLPVPPRAPSLLPEGRAGRRRAPPRAAARGVDSSDHRREERA